MRLFGEVDGVVDSGDVGWLMIPPFQHVRVDAPPLPAGGLTYQMILASIAVRVEALVGVPENVRVRTSPVAEEESRELLLCQIPDFEIRPYRTGASPGFIECQCEVTCYGWSANDPGRGGRLADRVLQSLERKTIPLFDYRDDAAPLLGYLKFREGEVLDRSRVEQKEMGSVQRVCAVRIRGIAEPLETE